MISWFPARSSAPNLPEQPVRAAVGSHSLREGACPNAPAHPPRDAVREAGQELVEFALILPLLLLLCLGIIEVSRLMLSHYSVANAAREGARQGIVDNAGIDAAARRFIIGLACDPPAEITPQINATEVSVTVICHFKTVIGNLVPALADVTLSSTATVQKE